MSSTSLRLLLLAATVLTLAPSSASALSCNRRIVSTGDVQHYVRSICGEPASITTIDDPRTQVVYDRRGIATVIVTSVQLEVWIYDFGPNRFMIELLFEGGEVTRERTLGRGTNAGRAASLWRAPSLTQPRSQRDAAAVARAAAHRTRRPLQPV